MAEFFFTAAWAAGFIEGSSVLNYANKRQDDARRRSTPLLLVPSILYSTAALPLGIIGASPGPSIVAWFPFAPPVLESGGKKVSLTKPELSTTTENKDVTHFKAAIPNTIDEAETTTEDENHPIMSHHDLVRKMREDNKRALLAMQQKQTQPAVTKQIRRHQPRVVPQTRAPRKLISTLDGPLSTPLAEAMRRARFLCIGAGLVLTVASYQQARQNELERERALQLEKQRNGRDADAIESFIKENGCKNGSVVRLLNSRDSIRDVTRSKGVIPLVHSVPPSFSILKANKEHDVLSSGHSAFWNLGTTPQEWRQTPLTKDWLFQTSGDVGNRSLVLEADLSCNSLSEYLSQQDAPTIQSMENIRWISNILGMIAQQNGVVSRNVKDEKACSSVTVLIGCGERPMELSEMENIVYMDGTASVAAKVYAVLEMMNSKPWVEEELENEPTTDDEGEQKGPALISALDYVGMKLRQGGTHVVTAIGGIFSRRREEKNVYVVSEHSFAPLWLRQVTPYEWTVIAFDALDDVETFQEMEEGGVTFVCCQTDEATSAIVCSLLLNGAGDAKSLVALVQDESCASSLRDLAIDLKTETHIEIVSVKGVHAELFGQARELLSSGKTPDEVQESIHASL